MIAVHRAFLTYFCFLFGVLMIGECLTKQDYIKLFRKTVNSNLIRDELRFITSRPRSSDSPGEQMLAEHIKKKWTDYGFQIEVPEYDVLQSESQEKKPNKISIINKNTGDVEHSITLQMNVTAGRGQGATKYTYTPFIYYAPNGTVEGELVYANLGSKSDLEVMSRSKVSLKGNIAILRSFIADIRNVIAAGAIGVVVYQDPVSFAWEGTGVNDTFPNKRWLPSDAVYSGSISNLEGDPLTPQLPSSSGIQRVDIKDTFIQNLVPIQSISYDDARYLLSRMQGVKSPLNKAGKLPITYRLGPGFKPTTANPAPILRLEVNNQYVTKKVRNVIATIPGSEEPDRYVLLGNHKDAVLFGGSDPASGTATLLEISRVLSTLIKKGWRPRRTIKLCSWGGQELGLTGSFEWVEENFELLRERVVAYLNTDAAVMGSYVLFTESSPMLNDLIINNAKEIQDPANSSMTLYDTMRERLRRSKIYPDEPKLNKLIYTSDYISFAFLTGLATGDFSFFGGKKNKLLISSVYHTQYDTFEWIERFGDPNFVYFRLMAQFLGSMLIDLSDSEILPFSPTRFVKSVQTASFFIKNAVGTKENLDQLQMSKLDQAIQEFSKAVKTFESKKQQLSSSQSNPSILRTLNDQMTGIEKRFISPYALRGLLFDQTSGSNKTFASSYSAMFKKLIYSDRFQTIATIVRKHHLTEGKKKEYMKFEMSLIIHAVRSATRLLKLNP